MNLREGEKIEIIEKSKNKRLASKIMGINNKNIYYKSKKELKDLKIKNEIENLARRAHMILGCKAYSRSDFIVSPRGIFFLETNTLPGLTSKSLLPKLAEAAGLEFSGLLEHLIQSSLV